MTPTMKEQQLSAAGTVWKRRGETLPPTAKLILQHGQKYC